MTRRANLHTRLSYALRPGSAASSRPPRPPGVILGSGLSGFADRLERPVVVPYDGIPSFPVSHVPGHPGRLVVGELPGEAGGAAGGGGGAAGARPRLRGLGGRRRGLRRPAALRTGGEAPARHQRRRRRQPRLRSRATWCGSPTTSTSPARTRWWARTTTGSGRASSTSSEAYDRRLASLLDACARGAGDSGFPPASTPACSARPTRPRPRSGCCGRWASTWWACRPSPR